MKLKIVFIALAFLLPVMFVRAADGLTQCFDYYDFGSVQVDVRPTNKDALSGTNILFSGNVRNTNAYPVVDGAVYIKVFRKAPQTIAQSNGWELVDQFFAKKDITIDGKKSYPLSFTWKAPAYAVGGDYKLATYFVSQDKYNLSGLSFTDDITGTIIPFKITGEQTKAVVFDRNSVKVSDKKFMFAAFTPKVGKSEPVTVSFNIKNEYTIAKNATVTYTLYSWDGLTAEKQINTKKENIVLKAGEVKALSYTVTDTAHPVYYLVVESKVDDVKSIIDIRFARQGVEEARLNFPALANYPLKQGAPATMFSCFHNSGLGEKINNGKVVMTLTDGKGKTVDTYTWEGAITGAMMAVKKEFTPTKDISNAILNTELYVNNKLVETSRTHYECSKINPEVCAAEAANAVGETSSTMMYIVIALALLVLIVAILAYHGHMKRKDVGVAALLFMSTLGLGMYQVQAKMAEAELIQFNLESSPLTYPANNVQGQYIYNADVNGNVLGMEAYNDFGLEGTARSIYIEKNVRSGKKNNSKTEFEILQRSAGYIKVDELVFQYVYGAEMRNAVTNAVIPDGATIPEGTKVKFVPVDFNNNHIAWFLSGSSFDSPYAYWDTGTVPTCNPSDKFGERRFMNGLIEFNPDGTFKKYTSPPKFDLHTSAYLPIVVIKPSVSTDADGSSADVTDNGDGTYTVTSPGVIKGNVTFAPTTAKAYFQYTFKDILGKNIVPMKLAGEGFVDYAPGQEAKLAAVAEGQCKTLTDFQFPLQQKTVSFTANVVAVDNNRPPYTPTFTISGTCQNVPLSARITAKSPADPDGDNVTYQYKVDNGSGYGAWQDSATPDFTVTFSTLGTKKVSGRVVDVKGAASASIEKIVKIVNCDSISAYCYDPVFVGPSSNSPQYNVKSFSSNTTLTYSYTWSWPAASFSTSTTNGVDSDTVTGSSMSPGETRVGPTVVMNASNGSTQTLNCPSATLSNPGGPSTPSFTASCTVDKINANIPTWRASITSGSGDYAYTWSGLTGTPSTNRFTSDKTVPSNGLDGLIVTIRDKDSGAEKDISCPKVSIVNDKKVDLFLSDSSKLPVKSVTVAKNSIAYAYTVTSGVTGCQPSKVKSTGASYSSWGSVDPDDKGTLQALVDYPLDTSETGKFVLTLTCRDPADPSNPALFKSSTSTLIITNNPNLEEI